MKEVADGIELACSDQSDVTSNTKTDIKTKSLHLPYRDNSTGEYKCGENDLIYVKFRSKFCRKTCFHNMKRKCLIFLYCLYTFITYLSTVMLRKKMSAPVFIHNVCLCVCFSSLWQLCRSWYTFLNKHGRRKCGGYHCGRSGCLSHRFSDLSDSNRPCRL